MESRSRWRQVDDLFRRALDEPDEDRASFVRVASGSDEMLRMQVMQLLNTDFEAQGFLESSAEEHCQLTWQSVFDSRSKAGDSEGHDVDRSGEQVGPYRLDRQVGRGGQTNVYLASRTDDQGGQRVAIKLLRHRLRTDDAVDQFLAQRQLLSSVPHPNIVRLFDGGATADGHAFLAMEYVDGVPLLTWCDERRASIEERLRLFCQVGRAVQHAHRCLFVHRDLKPSRVLVDRQGTVKLLDRGIGTLLEGDRSIAATRAVVLAKTPAYASPELVRGDPVTTASDVYQLGLLLCQLLTGRMPYTVDALSPARAHRQVVEATPSRPSALADDEAAATRAMSRHDLSRRLQGDLDVITLKALRSTPEERYLSVEALVDEVERHLRGEPVRTRPIAVS